MDTAALVVAALAGIVALLALSQASSLGKRLAALERQPPATDEGDAEDVAKRLQAVEKRAADVQQRLPEAERRAAEARKSIEKVLEQRLSDAEQQAATAIERADEALGLARSAAAPAASAPALAPVPAPPAEPPPEEPSRPDTKVVVRASEILAQAKQVAMLISFDFSETIGTRTGHKVPVPIETELDEQAIAHLKETEDAVLDVQHHDGETFIVLDTSG